MRGLKKTENVSIAIIDSGVDICREVFQKTNFFKITEDIKDDIGHGTAVASIIAKNVHDVDLYIYKLFEKEEYAEINELVAALKYINENYDFDIIHLSSGVVQYDTLNELYDICEELYHKGTTIVAAFDNEGSISYPAAFEHVIGVDWSEKCSIGSEYIYVKNGIVNIKGTGSLQKLPWIDGGYRWVSGSSFVAPYITARVARLRQKGVCELEAICSELERSAKEVMTISSSREDKIEEGMITEAVIYPFNKETENLIRNADLLKFKIKGIFEHSQFRRIGKSTNELLGIELEQNYTIESIRSLNWEDDFDTVILGHVGLLSFALKTDLIDFFIKQCIKYKKNLYAFDNLLKYNVYEEDFRKNNSYMFWAEKYKAVYPSGTLGKLHGIFSPVVGIFGTAPKEGKLTLQLGLKRAFEKMDYDVGLLGTEPSSMLLGMDEMYVMGYESQERLTSPEAILKINSLIHQIDTKRKDIIIACSQSQTIPMNTGALGHYPMEQHEFLTGIEPDCMILCIDPYDDKEYIERTKQYLEAYSNKKVLALMMMPFCHELEWDIQAKKKRSLTETELCNRKELYETIFKIPCLNICKNEDVEYLTKRLIELFS